ncbi:MAG TPA: TIM barrel protein [Anaerolineae bacterium]|nr:TIM barrel protein [Anaerolineae bacterium]
MKKTDRLLFGTAGAPHSAKPRDTVTALKRLNELGLDAMELEYVRGTFPGETMARTIASVAEKHDIRLTAHGPYFINLNAEDPEKLKASRKRVLNTAYFGGLSGAESITFHAGFFLNRDPIEVYRHIYEELKALVYKIRDMGIDVDVRPELTGKSSQFGSLDEILTISKELDGVEPCIDWSHLHARTGYYNTAREFQSVIDRIRSVLGEGALKQFHMHISGIEYGNKGEKKHLNLDESDFNYRELLQVLKDNGICGFIICESPSLESDALLLKEAYDKI